MAFRILLRTSSLVMWSLYEMPRRRLKLLISIVCIFPFISAVMSKSHKNIKLWTWPRSATVWSLSWGLCSCRPRWSWVLWVLLWSGQSWSVFQAWILRQWLWLPNIWSFEWFPASRHWPWRYIARGVLKGSITIWNNFFRNKSINNKAVLIIRQC